MSIVITEDASTDGDRDSPGNGNVEPGQGEAGPRARVAVAHRPPLLVQLLQDQPQETR